MSEYEVWRKEQVDEMVIIAYNQAIEDVLRLEIGDDCITCLEKTRALRKKVSE